MVRDNKTALCTPIIGRVIELNRYVLLKRQLVSKTIRHTHFVTLLTSCNLLFQMAMRQVRGKDYYKRAKELNEEIQYQAYLIHSLNQGWDMKTVATIDAMCDEINEQLYKIAQSARVEKPDKG